MMTNDGSSWLVMVYDGKWATSISNGGEGKQPGTEKMAPDDSLYHDCPGVQDDAVPSTRFLRA